MPNEIQSNIKQRARIPKEQAKNQHTMCRTSHIYNDYKSNLNLKA